MLVPDDRLIPEEQAARDVARLMTAMPGVRVLVQAARAAGSDAGTRSSRYCDICQRHEPLDELQLAHWLELQAPDDAEG